MEVIVQKYEGLVRKYIGKVVYNVLDIEDLIQEVWVKVFLKGDTFDISKGTFSTWLINVSKNTAIDFTRKKRLNLLPLENTVEPSVAMDFSWENKHIVEKAIANLPNKNQQLINAYFFERKSHKEIAEEMGWKGNRSGVEIKRSCIKLKEQLDKDFIKEDLIV